MSTPNLNNVVDVTSFHSVHLQRQFGDFEVDYVGRSPNRLIHIILPYFHRPAALKVFLARFTGLAKGAQPLALTVVRFSEGLPAMDEAEERKDRSTTRALLEASGSPVTLLEADGRFSPEEAYRVAAARMSKEESIVMLAHVDLLFGKRFLQRCQANAWPGERAYYPVLFSTYNPDIAYGVFKKKVHQIQENYENSNLLHDDLGYWLNSDYSVSCQYMSDFRRFSDLFSSNTGHVVGVNRYEMFVKNDVEVIRMPDPDLVQVYHKVTCLKEMGTEQYNACLKTKAMDEASKLEWGLWVYKHLGDTDDVEQFLKMHNFEIPLPTRSSLNA